MDELTGAWTSKKGLVPKLKGGVILDVITPEHARIAEEAGACAVVVHGYVPTDARAESRVGRMSNPELILEIKAAVSILVMAKCRIGHFVEAQILQDIGVDAVDESEDLTRSDNSHYIWKHNFDVPFMCGASDFGEALRRIGEGAAMLRTKDGGGKGNISETVKQVRSLLDEIRHVRGVPEDELMTYTKEIGVSLELLKDIKEQGRLPVAIFASAGISTPADAALVMQLGAHGVWISSDIFETREPVKRIKAIVRAARFSDNIDFVAHLSRSLETPMKNMLTNPEIRGINSEK